ncbi:helix-turn-helix domain-containing protein [Mesorhizobium sp. A556]
MDRGAWRSRRWLDEGRKRGLKIANSRWRPSAAIGVYAPDTRASSAHITIKEDRTIPTHKNECNPAHDDTLGGRISLAREAANLSIAQAARRLGVMTASWNAWECDRDEPRGNRLAMMAGLLGVSPSWLLAGHGSGPSEIADSDVTKLLRELGRASEGAAAINKRVQQITASLEQIQKAGDEPAAA